MTTATLADGTQVFCLRKSEAHVLDHHIQGYMAHGIEFKRGNIIFDVGANIGLFGVRAMQADPEAQVYAFEPIPSIYNVMKKNAERFGPGRYHAMPFGLSDKPGRLQFVYFPNSPALSTAHPEMWDENPGLFSKAVMGTLKNPPPHMWWTRWVPGFFAPLIAKVLTRGREEVDGELRTISQVIEDNEVPHIDLLKVDCEGAELDVLLGLKEKHWPLVQKVVVEIHDVENRLQIIQDMLIKHGLTQQRIEKEEGLEATSLFNLYATRPTPET
jgi:FkbM family methyltransferase